jgi:cytochrome c2
MFLAKPSIAVPGNRMSFAGIPDANDRQDVIANLVRLKPSGK